MPVTDLCCCPPEAGSMVCELPARNLHRPPRAARSCPECGRTGKPVQGQTVKALLSTSLRGLQEGEYLFCRTQTCPVVYFSADGKQIFTVDQVRERVYQKEQGNGDVFVCYCFRHTIADIRSAAPGSRTAILDDIQAGIDGGQCACDLRNPQGSCCLGNVRALIRRFPDEGVLTPPGD